jgi:hypothetical protein
MRDLPDGRSGLEEQKRLETLERNVTQDRGREENEERDKRKEIIKISDSFH